MRLQARRGADWGPDSVKRRAGGGVRRIPSETMNEDAHEVTPNGCRFDNGRCFDRLELEPGEESIYAYFRDGSEYRFVNLEPVVAILWISQFDAGCFFNHHIRPGDFEKLKGPD